MAAPLDEAQSRALSGLLAEKAGRFRCPCQSELHSFLVARGRPIAELPFTVDHDDVPSWEDEWVATLESATADKCTKLDVKQLVLWLKARGSSSSLLAHTSGLARVALEALTDHGIAVEASVAADLERRLTLSEAGEEQKQCENAMVAYLIITNHPPTEDQVSDWERRVASQKGKEVRNVNLVGEDARTRSG